MGAKRIITQDKQDKVANRTLIRSRYKTAITTLKTNFQNASTQAQLKAVLGGTITLLDKVARYAFGEGDNQ